MEQYVTTGGARIRYEVDGPPNKPALLFINALGTTADLWARQLPGLKVAFRVIRYDVRGQGESSVVPGEYTLDELGQDAVAVLDAAGVSTAHVCGLSIGGLVAMWMGVHAPARISSLILANTAARIGTRQRWEDRIAIVRTHGMRAVAEFAMPLWFTEGFRRRDPDTVHVFRSMVEDCPKEGYISNCAAVRDGDLRDAIGAIRCPTLVIAGGQDTLTPVADAEFIRDHVPGARLLVLDAAHLSNVEQAEPFTSAVMEQKSSMTS